ncbi:DUF1648 domain-containing protein [Allochromatium palmeri]|nr:DUF1648 domain-containing protein [Allochromatium palmeri]
MHLALYLSFFANLILALVSWAILPERVAIHFGAGGVPDDWGSSLAMTGLSVGLSLLLFGLLTRSADLVRRVPARWINLPNRAYWLAPERREATAVRLHERLQAFGTALFGLLFVAGLLTLEANLSDPVRLDEPLFLVALGSFLIYTLYWTWSLTRAFRVPSV